MTTACWPSTHGAKNCANNFISYLTVTVTFGRPEKVSCTALANSVGVRWLDGISIKRLAMFCPSAFTLPSFHWAVSLELQNNDTKMLWGKESTFQLTEYPCNNTYYMFSLDILRIVLEHKMIQHDFYINIKWYTPDFFFKFSAGECHILWQSSSFMT